MLVIKFNYCIRTVTFSTELLKLQSSLWEAVILNGVIYSYSAIDQTVWQHWQTNYNFEIQASHIMINTTHSKPSL